METTNFTFLSSLGIPLVGSGYIPYTSGNYWFVNDANGDNGAAGNTTGSALKSIAEAVARAQSKDVIIVAPGVYSAIIIPRSVGALTIVGLGNLGDAAIVATIAGQRGLTYSNDDLTLINIGVAGESTADYACFGTGSRFREYGCKFEGVDTSGAALGFGPGSVAAVAAGTEGNCGDIKLYSPELAWSFDGIALVASDYGVPTQVYIESPLFHNISDIEIIGIPGAFGIGSVRNIECKIGMFDNMEDATQPSKYIELNTAFDTGMFAQNSFAIATNAAAKLDIGAGIFWSTNYTEAGPSTARPA